MHESTSSGAELFRAGVRTDGQTCMTKPEVAFCNFSNAPKKESLFILGEVVSMGYLFSTVQLAVL